MAKKTLARKQKKRGGKRARKTQKRIKGGMTPALLVALALVLGTAQGFVGSAYNTNINGKQHIRGNNNLNKALETLAEDNIIKYEDTIMSGPTVKILDCNAAFDIIEEAVKQSNNNSISESDRNAIKDIYNNFSCSSDGDLDDDEGLITKAFIKADPGLSIYLNSIPDKIKKLENSIAILEGVKTNAMSIDKKKNTTHYNRITNQIKSFQDEINIYNTILTDKKRN